MYLPGGADCLVFPGKLSDYLLNLQHPDGGSKARFLMRFGFRVDEPGTLERALLAHALMHEVVESRVTPFGVNHALEGALTSPDQRNPRVRTVWFVGQERRPKFVTLRPA